MEDLIKGRKPVLTALENDVTINKIYLSKTAEGEIVAIIFRLARKKGIVCTYLDRKEIDQKAGENNQGVFALISPIKYATSEDFVEILKKNKRTVFAMLDSVTDPHNVGAIIRSAYAFGVSGIILPKRNSCLINSTVLKASAGAATMLPILQVNNLAQTIDEFKEHGLWFIGADASGEPVKNLKLNDRNLCIILGSEGDGIKRLVKEKSDYLAQIPLKNEFDSLNVSCAASILFYEFLA